MAKIFTEQENQAWASQLPGKMTSACVALRADDKVLMVKPSYKDYWTFPGGIVDPNESPLEGAIRETYEEVGLTLQPNSCQFLAVAYTPAGDQYGRDRFNFAFITHLDSTDVALSAPNDEIELVEWVPIHDVAARSGGRGSYTNFQRILLTGEPYQTYVEVARVD